MVLLFVNYRYAYSLLDPPYSERCQVPFSADNFKFYAVIFHFYKVRRKAHCCSLCNYFSITQSASSQQYANI